MKLKMVQTLIANDVVLNPGDKTEMFDGADAERLISWGFAVSDEPPEDAAT